MGSNWKRYSFEDCMEAIIDYRGKTPKKTTSGIPLITAKIIKNGSIQPVKEFIAEDDYESWMRRGIPKAGDVVLTTEAPLGEVAQLDERKIALAQRVITLRGKTKFLDNTFLKYLLISSDVQHQLDGRGTGTTVKGIKQSELRQLELPIPDFNTQLSIAKILGDLDKKNHLNNETNETLEQMAQALFKSWFVDFDPVFDNLLASVDFKLENLENRLPDELKQKAQRRLVALNSLENAAQCKASLSALAHELQAQLPTKEATQAAGQVSGEAAEISVKANLNANPNILAQHANTHAHFPNEFEHNEQLGWIPKGWEASKLKEFGKIITGKTPPKKIDDAFDLEGKGVPFITPSDVEGDVFTVNAIRHLTESGVGSVKNNIVDAESVCVTCIGSQMGKTTIAPEKSVTNQQLNSIVLGKKYFRNYIFLNLRMRREELFNLGSSGSTMPILNKTSFENLSVLKPNESSLKAFDDITESYLAKILLNSQNNTKLTTMRDTLLPKLISGELQIPDVATDDETVD